MSRINVIEFLAQSQPWVDVTKRDIFGECIPKLPQLANMSVKVGHDDDRYYNAYKPGL